MKTVLFTVMAACSSLAAFSQSSSDSIVLNQLGFYPHAPKIAAVKGNTTAEKFYIVGTHKHDTAYSSALGEEMHSSNSSTITRIADFSALSKQGEYVLYIPGLGTSYPFSIMANANHAAAIASLKGFYYIRSDMPLDEPFAGKWHRAAGHADTAVVIHSSAASAARPEGTVISSPGGWYDAGDYNKYIVNSGISMGTLLSAYEDFSSYFDTLHTNIPESGDKVPDVLNEAIYNLRWMLTMQDPNDGGVYHKCTNASFDGMVMPGVTTLPRYAVQKGTAATLDFAAVAAQAARILKLYKTAIAGTGRQLPEGLSTSMAMGKEKP